MHARAERKYDHDTSESSTLGQFIPSKRKQASGYDQSTIIMCLPKYPQILPSIIVFSKQPKRKPTQCVTPIPNQRHQKPTPPPPPKTTIPRSSFRSPYTWLPESCRRITSQRLHHATFNLVTPQHSLTFPQSIPKPSLGGPAHENGLQSKLRFYLHRYALAAKLAALSPPKWKCYKLEPSLEGWIAFLLEILWRQWPQVTLSCILHHLRFDWCCCFCLLQGDAESVRERERPRPPDWRIYSPSSCYVWYLEVINTTRRVIQVSRGYSLQWPLSSFPFGDRTASDGLEIFPGLDS